MTEITLLYLPADRSLKTNVFMPEPEGSRHQGEYILVVVVMVVMLSFLTNLKIILDKEESMNR